MRYGGRSRRRVGQARESPWRPLLRFIILLTLPCYCVGGLALGATALVGRAPSGVDWTPWLVVAVLLLLLVLLTEPWHGGVSACADIGMQCAEAGLGLATDPIGCGTLLFLLAAAVVLALIFFAPMLSGLLPMG